MDVEKIKVFIVDDDPLFLRSLEMDFQQNSDFEIELFPTGELCIANLSRKPDVIILDFFLNSVIKDAMNGMRTLDAIKKIDPSIPVVMLSVSADQIRLGVELVDHDAFDFVPKNKFSFSRLQSILTLIFQQSENGKEIVVLRGYDELPYQLSAVSC